MIVGEIQNKQKIGSELWFPFPNIEKSGVSKTWGQIAVLGLYVRGSVYQAKRGAAISVFQVLDSLSVKFGFLIPVSSGIPTSIIMMYSRIQSPGFWIPQQKLAGFRNPQAKFAGLRNPNSLLWGEGMLKTQEIIASIFLYFSLL